MKVKRENATQNDKYLNKRSWLIGTVITIRKILPSFPSSTSIIRTLWACISKWDRKIHPSASFSRFDCEQREQKEDRTMAARQKLREKHASEPCTRKPIYRHSRRVEFSSRTRSNETKVSETERKGGNWNGEKGKSVLKWINDQLSKRSK